MNVVLQPRLTRKGLCEYETPERDYVIARCITAGVWLVTAHSADLRAEVQGYVSKEDAGFRGRQWESTIDGQQYPSLIEAVREAVAIVQRRARIAEFRENLRKEKQA